MTIIQLAKFGHLLSSRELGREAWQAFLSSHSRGQLEEPVIVDCGGVSTLSHSWGDEFLSSLLAHLQGPLTFRNTGNASVRATLEYLQEIHGKRLVIEP